MSEILKTLSFAFGKPPKGLCHLIDAGSNLRQETVCGKKRWKAATTKREWATCKACLEGGI